MTALSTPTPRHTAGRAYWIVSMAVVAWFAAYNLIQPLANWLAYTAFHLTQGSHLGDAVALFLYDIPKILLLLSGMVFVISIIRTWFSPERTRALLGGKRAGIGNALAAMLGIV